MQGRDLSQQTAKISDPWATADIPSFGTDLTVSRITEQEHKRAGIDHLDCKCGTKHVMLEHKSVEAYQDMDWLNVGRDLCSGGMGQDYWRGGRVHSHFRPRRHQSGHWIGRRSAGQRSTGCHHRPGKAQKAVERSRVQILSFLMRLF